jgi:hypothetical protein
VRWFQRCAAAAGLAAFLAAASGAAARVVVPDQVGVLGAPVSLVVRTTSLLGSDGGRLVDLSLDGEPLGRLMTGADGYGYRRATPQRAGLLRVEARSEGREAWGRLLVMEPAERAVVIELETVLKAMVAGAAQREECRAGLESISRGFRVIYAARWLGTGWSRTRTIPAGLPESVVIPWKGAALLRSLHDRGIRPFALVGSAAAVSEGRPHVALRFSFEKTRNAAVVSRWEEIARRLEAETSRDAEAPLNAGD